MITTGIKSANNQSDSLLMLLADPKKTEAALKKIIAENKKLATQTKDLMKAKSLAAFCTEKEKEAEKAKSYVTQATEEITQERKKIDEYKKSVSATLGKRLAAIEEKEEAANVTAKLIAKQLVDIEEQYAGLEKQLEDLYTKERKALAMKEEYTTKLNDLKERMRGL